MGRRLALLIATYRYQDDGLRQLTAPAHDAEALASVLRDPAIAGFEVTILVNEPHHRVGEAIGDFYRDRRRDDLTLLYFTGHGLKDDDGRLYLAMTNTRRGSLLFTSLAAEQIDRAMEDCASRQKVLILDCCYSGAFPAGRLAKADTEVHALERFQGRGRTVLTASDATQYSFEGDQLHGGAVQSVFTRHLVAGLRDGSADLDGDGDITLDELYSYVHDRVVEEMPQQRPKKQDNVEGRTVIARNVNWSLPTYLRNAIASPIATDRRNAIDGLFHLHRVGNDLVRRTVVEEIRRLAGDDSRTVSAVAAEHLAAIAPTDAAAIPERPVESAPAPEPIEVEPPPEPDVADAPTVTSATPRSRTPRRRRLVFWGLLGAILLAATTLTVIISRSLEDPPNAALGEPIPTRSVARALAVGQLDGKPVVIADNGPESLLRAWDLATHQPVGDPIATGDPNRGAEPALSIAVTQLDGKPAVVHLAFQPDQIGVTWVRVWDLTSRQPAGNPIESGPAIGAFYCIAVGRLDDTPVLLTGGSDGAVRVWNLVTHQPIGQPLTARGSITAIALGQADGKPVAVTGGLDRTVRIWDLATRQQIGQPLTGHTDVITAIALGQLNGKPIAISTSHDRTARVWDLSTQQPIGLPLDGHTDKVQAVAFAELDGKPVAVTGGIDRTVRVWDLATRQQIGQPLTGHTEGVYSLAVGQVTGKPVIASGGDDNTIRMWDLTTVPKR
jgi:hypothetical protein